MCLGARQQRTRDHLGQLRIRFEQLPMDIDPTLEEEEDGLREQGSLAGPPGGLLVSICGRLVLRLRVTSFRS